MSSPKSKKNSRRTALKAAALGAIPAALGVSHLVNISHANHNGANDELVEICHNGRTIYVSQDSVAAHLAHGDTLGSCESDSDSGGS